MKSTRFSHVVGSLAILGLLLASGCDAATKDGKAGNTVVNADGSVQAGSVKVDGSGVQAGDAKVNADGSVQAGAMGVTNIGADGKTATITGPNGVVIQADATGDGKVKMNGLEADGSNGGTVKAAGLEVDGAGGGKVKAGGVEVDGDAGTVNVNGIAVDATGVTLPSGAKVHTGGAGATAGHSAGGGKKACPGGSCKQVCKDGGELSCDGGSFNQTAESGSCTLGCRGGSCNQTCKAGASCDLSCDGGSCKRTCTGTCGKKTCVGGDCTG